MKRATLVGGMTLVLLAAESAAARFAWADEGRVFVVLAVLAALTGLALLATPLPARWLPALPATLVGLFHLVQVGPGPSGRWTALVSLAAAAHVVLLAGGTAWLLARVRGPEGRGVPRAKTRTLGVFAAGYLAQASACALLLFPQGLAPIQGHLVLAFSCTTVAPLLASWAACEALRPRAPGGTLSGAAKLGALGVLVASVLLPWSLRWPLLFGLHRVLPEPGPPAAHGLPDVLLLVLDTTRADRMSVYGHPRPTTPRLEELARSSSVYEQAVSQGVWTLPGHASIFTGLYLPEHKVANDTPLTGSAVTLAEWFRAAGYRTACVASNQMFRADAAFGLDQGFEFLWCEQPMKRYLALPNAARWIATRLSGWLPSRAMAHVDALLRPAQPALREWLSPAREVARVGLTWLDRTRGQAPRLLFLNLMEAHGMARKHACGAPLFGEGRAFSWYQADGYQQIQAGLRDAAPADRRRLEDWYDSSLACMDLHVGELLDGLRERDLLDDMLVVVVSDHGEMLGDLRAFGHRGEVWQGLVHVPLMIKRPGQRDGARCDEPVETASLAAALPALAGLPPLEGLPRWAGELACVPDFVRRTLLASPDGASGARPALDDPCALPRRRALPLSNATPSEGQSRDLNDRWHRGWLAIREGPLKFLVASDGERRVADLRTELPEEHAGPPTPEQDLRLEGLLAEWRAQTLDLGARVRAAAGGDAEARRDVLRQLGYVDGE